MHGQLMLEDPFLITYYHDFELGRAEHGGEEASDVLPVGRRYHEHVLVVHLVRLGVAGGESRPEELPVLEVLVVSD